MTLRRIISRWRKVVVNLAVVLAVLVIASFVPPDASLSHIKQRGVLRVCAPPQMVGEAEGALLQRIVDNLAVRLQLDYLPSMGGDANPRNWRISRAQCDMIGGGLVDNATTRSFLTVVPSGLETGWASWPRPLQECGQVALYTGVSGLDRIGLSRALKQAGIRPVLVGDVKNLPFSDAESVCAVAEITHIRGRYADHARIFPVNSDAISQTGFGLWKGDATLARAVRKVLGQEASASR